MRVLSNLLLSLVWSAAPAALAGSCPDLSSYRSDNVLGHFDPSRLEGLWYESAFIDIAQVGASCQTLNASYDAGSGRLTMPFSVKYGALPFTIVEIYNPENATGMYLKHVNMPGGKLLQLDTVMVDVTAPNATAPYETLTMVSCVDVLGIPTKEVVFAMRVPLDAGNHALLDKMKTTARRLGVEWDESKLKEVSFDKC
eukprot:g4500.t1